MTHPDFRRKLEAVGFGFFIPAFFVTSGVRFDLDALTASASSLLMVPIFLLALLAARGLPAVVYRRALDARHTAIAGLMQATSLPFIVAATAIGMELDLIDAAASAALIGAGLLSVVLFPLGGLLLLRRATRDRPGDGDDRRGETVKTCAHEERRGDAGRAAALVTSRCSWSSCNSTRPSCCASPRATCAAGRSPRRWCRRRGSGS